MAVDEEEKRASRYLVPLSNLPSNTRPIFVADPDGLRPRLMKAVGGRNAHWMCRPNSPLALHNPRLLTAVTCGWTRGPVACLPPLSKKYSFVCFNTKKKQVYQWLYVYLYASVFACTYICMHVSKQACTVKLWVLKLAVILNDSQRIQLGSIEAAYIKVLLNAKAFYSTYQTLD